MLRLLPLLLLLACGSSPIAATDTDQAPGCEADDCACGIDGCPCTPDGECSDWATECIDGICQGCGADERDALDTCKLGPLSSDAYLACNQSMSEAKAQCLEMVTPPLTCECQTEGLDCEVLHNEMAHAQCADVSPDCNTRQIEPLPCINACIAASAECLSAVAECSGSASASCQAARTECTNACICDEDGNCFPP